jgi:quinol monooxygenase YgiN
MIIVRIAMNALSEKQKEVMQALVSMSEFTGMQKGCLSHHVFRDIEDGEGFQPNR